MTMNNDEKFFENEFGVYFKSNYPSQWHKVDFVIDGVTYNCCEQWMMAAKARTFGDLETEKLILGEVEPKEQKKLGRKVANFDEREWNKVADDIVFEGNLAKFSQNEDLKRLLLATGKKDIVECSPYDEIWGNGLNITDTLNTPKDEWKGTNRLGKALMLVRDELRR